MKVEHLSGQKIAISTKYSFLFQYSQISFKYLLEWKVFEKKYFYKRLFENILRKYFNI